MSVKTLLKLQELSSLLPKRDVRIAIRESQEQTWRRYEKGINRFVDFADRLCNTSLSAE